MLASALKTQKVSTRARSNTRLVILTKKNLFNHLSTSKGCLSYATVVIFSIETTYSSRNKGICQISATCNNHYFQLCIIPDEDSTISFDNSGFEIDWCWRKFERILLFRGEEQKSFSPKDGLKRFLRFLKHQNGKLLLAAHNCFKFQGPVIVQQMKRYGLYQAFEEYVAGFIDTKTIFKSIMKRRKEENRSFSLDSLAEDYFALDIYSDDCGEVSVIEALLRELKCTDTIMKQYARSLNEFVAKSARSDTAVVIFSIETTNLTRNKGICQIAASCNNQSFEQYIIPDEEIDPIISEINGFEIKWSSKGRQLIVRGEELNEALPPKKGLKEFLRFLKQQNGKVLLAAHNCFKFQGHVIVRQMKRYGLFEAFEEHVIGFIDTIQVFESIMKQRKEQKQSFALPSLAAYFGLDIDNEENNKVTVIGELLNKINCTDTIMKQHARPLDEFIRKMPGNVESTVDDFEPLKDVVSKTMLGKMVRAGITLNALMKVFEENGKEGVTNFLQEDIQGKPRVTKTRTIIQALIDKLLELKSEIEEEVPHKKKRVH